MSMALAESMDGRSSPVSTGDSGGGRLPCGSLVFEAPGRIVAICPDMIRMFGRPILHLSERVDDSDVFPGRQVLDALRKAREGWGPAIQLVTLERQHRHYVLVRTEVVKNASSGERMLATVTDLTELLRQSHLAEDFVRQVRHDLRGPLTSLRGAVDLLRSERVGRLDQRQTKLLELMDRAAQQMADMLSRVPGESSGEPNSAL